MVAQKRFGLLCVAFLTGFSLLLLLPGHIQFQTDIALAAEQESTEPDARRSDIISPVSHPQNKDIFDLTPSREIDEPASQSPSLPQLQGPSNNEPLIGEPCGSGELLPRWTICLHGSVYWIDAQHQTTPLASIPITISLAGQIVTGTTFIHPGKSEPTYGIDISPLTPIFLQPVTLTAVVSGQVYMRQVTVFPDFATMSQHFDLQLSDPSGLPTTSISGQVIDFSEEGPVAGAVVELQYGNMVESRTTISTATFTGYRFDDIDIEPGTVVTLTATYNDDSDQQVVRIGEEPIQVNLVTGWYCDQDEFDPLPRVSGGGGLPRVGPGGGLPDVACFWGYGFVDGEPAADVTVRMVISDTLYERRTKLFPGETIARYSLSLLGGDALAGAKVQASGIYSQFESTRNFTVALDSDLSQQFDFDLAEAIVADDFSYANEIRALVWQDQYLWAGTTGGVVRWDSTDGTYRKFTIGDALASNHVLSIALNPNDNSLWFGTLGGVSHYTPSGNPEWETFTAANSGLVADQVRAIAIDTDDDSLWFGTWQGISHYTPNTASVWETVTLANSNHASNIIHELAVDPRDNSLWIGTVNGVSHYMPGSTPDWETFTSDNSGLVSGQVRSIAIDAINDTVWFGANQGVSQYKHNSMAQWITFTIESGLVSNWVRTIEIDQGSGIYWFGTDGGVSRYTPQATNLWTTFTTTHGLPSNWVEALAIHPTNKSIGFGTLQGISHYQPENSTVWQAFITNDDYLTGGWVEAIAIDPTDNSLWLATRDGGTHYNPISIPGWHTFPFLTGDGSIALKANDGSQYFFSVDRPANISQTGRNNTVNVKNDGIPVVLSQTGNGFTIVRHNPERTYIEAEFAGTIIVDEAPNPGQAITIDKTDGSVWFGTTNNGLLHYSPGNISPWQTFNLTNSDLPHNHVKTIDQDSNDGSLWLGTWAGVTQYKPNSISEWQTFTITDGLVHNWVETIVVDEVDSSIWVGTWGGVSHYTPGATQEWRTFTITSGLAHNTVHAIAIDPDDRSLWFGTSNGVSHYTPGALQEWETFTTTHGLAHNEVHAIIAQPGDIMWFGTWGGGVSLFRPDEDSQWQTFTTEDGLTHNQVRSMAFDENNSLWVGTQAGLSKLDISLEKSDLVVDMETPNFVLAGQNVTYTLNLANQGGANAANVVLTTTLPANVSFVGANPAPISAQPLVWQFDKLSANSSASPIVIVGQLDANATPAQPITANVTVKTRSLEAFAVNNRIEATSLVRDPFRADLRVNLMGPPILVPGGEAEYKLWVDNIGGLAANNTILTVEAPAGMSYQQTDRPPVSANPLRWDLETLQPSFDTTSVISTTVVFNVSDQVEPDTALTVSAVVTTATDETNLDDNQTSSTIVAALSDAQTLILVAPERLATLYGASPILSQLDRLAVHPLVQGVVLDVERDNEVQAAYIAWDNDPGDWQNANDVASAIKALVDQYAQDYPGLRYLVLVGSDDIIPFYRVADQNSTSWQESQYNPNLPASAAQAALKGNRLLTDDFYADRVPSIPNSELWEDNHPFFLPDLAIGRLVESPAEIEAVINSFLTNNGQIELGPAVIGADSDLASDLGEAQCDIIEGDGLSSQVCTTDESEFRAEFLAASNNASIWTAQHSNHQSLGSVKVEDIQNRAQDFAQSLLVTIGCHAGLNIPHSGPNNARLSLDLVQATAGKGGTYIGSTAYTYASGNSIVYSEELALAIMQQLLGGSTHPLGEALIQAKQAYYVERSGNFNYTDEKVLVPLTLYGLPMLQVNTPAILQREVTIAGPLPPFAVTKVNSFTVATHNLTGLGGEITSHSHPHGAYYRYQDTVLDQDKLPLQPFATLPISFSIGAESVRAVLLRSAAYTSYTAFNPIIAQTFIFEPLAQNSAPEEPAITFKGWDRALPYALSDFDGIHKNDASLNLTLGAFNADSQIEHLFRHLSLDVIYSQSTDRVPPDLVAYQATRDLLTTEFMVEAIDPAGLSEVNVVYDNGESQWRNLVLAPGNGDTWLRQINTPVTRYYVQVVDTNGNVTISDWQTLPPQHRIYLPLMHKNAAVEVNDQVDLIVENVLFSQTAITAVIKNIGTAPSSVPFWVDLYLNPDPPPNAVNQVWSDLGQYGAAWGVSTLLSANESVTLTLNDSYFQPAHSNLNIASTTGITIYAQVDSLKEDTTYGAILESHENGNAPYNNLFGPVYFESQSVNWPVLPTGNDQGQNRGNAVPNRSTSGYPPYHIYLPTLSRNDTRP